MDATPATSSRTASRDGLVDAMAASVGRIAAAFTPRPVVYRATDFRSNEFRGLRGGETYEPVEHNPMIGYRGCYRYVREADFLHSSSRPLRGCASRTRTCT